MTTSTKKLSKEEFVQIMMKSMMTKKIEREIKQEFQQKQKQKQKIQKQITNIQPEERNLKLNDYYNEVLKPMIKRLNKYQTPPFSKKIEHEYIYSKYDLQIIIQEVHNPYLTIRNIPNWDGYGKELYLSEEGVMEI